MPQTHGTGNEAQLRLANGDRVMARRQSGLLFWTWFAKGESDRTLKGLQAKLNKKAGKRPWWQL